MTDATTPAGPGQPAGYLPPPPPGYQPQQIPGYQPPQAPPPPPGSAPPGGYQQPPGYPPPGPYGPVPGQPRNGRTVVLVVVAVIALMFVGTLVSCGRACVGCGIAARHALHDSVSMRTWGWNDGDGPTTWTTIHFSSDKPARDRAPHSDANDAQLEQGLRAIYAGLNAYHEQHGDYPPPFTDLESQLGPYVDPWPTNPWTGGPMVIGDHRGDIEYSPASDSLELGVDLGK